ncbi:MAG: response regulator [Oligoflexales bacterium]|nr:response regulator [Oligoflexales bacterium]
MLQRVLVADDSEPVQKAIQIALEPYNVEIFEASSFVEALNICKKKSPNLIIADASLTGTDAPKEFKIMSNTAGEVPVLLLEGSFEPIDKEGFEAIGLSCFLKKPFNISEIEEAIKEQMQISLPVKGLEEAPPQKRGDVPPPPPMVGRSKSPSWENQLVESDLHLDLSMSGASEDLEDEPATTSGTDDALPELEESSESKLDLSVTEEELQEALLRTEPDLVSEPELKANPDVDVMALPEEEPSQESDQEKQEDHSLNLDTNPVLIESLIPVLQQEILPLLKQEVEEQVKKAIIEYCELHFKRLARDVIKEELRSLASD